MTATSRTDSTKRRSDPPGLGGPWWGKIVIGTIPAIAAGLIAWGAINSQLVELSDDVREGKVERATVGERVRVLEISSGRAEEQARSTARALGAFDDRLEKIEVKLDELLERTAGRRPR